jgi:uridine phosphorylase
VEKIAASLDEAHKVSDYRGLVTYSGKVDGIGISACSTGIGCPSAAIVVEELTRIGAETLIRVGTAGSLQRSIDIGELVIANSAVRADGASKVFMPVEYPAVADFDVTSALVQAAKKLKKKRGRMPLAFTPPKMVTIHAPSIGPAIPSSLRQRFHRWSFR